MKSSNVATVVTGARAASRNLSDGGEDAPTGAGRWQALFSALGIADSPVRETWAPA